MLSIVSSSSLSFAPPASVLLSRPAVRVESPLMAEEAPSRRELFAKAGAALFSFSAVQGASAKAGQFSRQDFFSISGTPAISSPYQPNGPKAGKDATFGYAKSDGPMLATGYETDVTRVSIDFRVAPRSCHRGDLESAEHVLGDQSTKFRLGGFFAAFDAEGHLLHDSKATRRALRAEDDEDEILEFDFDKL